MCPPLWICHWRCAFPSPDFLPFSRPYHLSLPDSSPCLRLHSLPLSLSALFFFFFNFWPRSAACKILVPWPGIETTPPAVEAESPKWLEHQGIRWIKLILLDRIYLTFLWRAIPSTLRSDPVSMPTWSMISSTHSINNDNKDHRLAPCQTLFIKCLSWMLLFISHHHLWGRFCCAQSLQLRQTLCNPMDCSLPGSSIHEIL